MKPIEFGWGQGVLDVFVVENEKKVLVPDSEFGSSVSNLKAPFKTVVTYESRSGLSGSGLIFFEKEQNLKKIPVVPGNDPAFYRIVNEFPFAVVNRQQKEIEIVWGDYSSILISFDENRKGEIQQFSPEENGRRVRDSAELMVKDQVSRVLIKRATMIKTRAGTVRIPLELDQIQILAIKLYDGVWEHWNWGRDLSPSYLLRSNEEALRFFIDKKPQPRLIFGGTFSWGPNCGPAEEPDYIEPVGKFFIMKTTGFKLISCLGFDGIPDKIENWYYLVPQESWEGLGFYTSDLQYCEDIANFLTEAEE